MKNNGSNKKILVTILGQLQNILFSKVQMSGLDNLVINYFDIDNKCERKSK